MLHAVRFSATAVQVIDNAHPIGADDPASPIEARVTLRALLFTAKNGLLGAHCAP